MMIIAIAIGKSSWFFC